METSTDRTPTTTKKKDGATTFTILMMLLALLCVGITAAIAFYDMSR